MKQNLCGEARSKCVVCLALVSGVACGSSGPAGSAGAAGPDAGGGAEGSTTQHIKTVFLVLMENKVWSEIKGSPDAPFVNGTILGKASIAEAYRGPSQGNIHPSEPNYLWLEAGNTFGITNDNDPAINHQSTTAHLVTELEHANVSWRSYQEDIAGDVCPLTGVANYAPKHDPMVFFNDVTNSNDPMSQRCIAHVRPLTELDTDLAGNKVARYNFVTPNQCNDMHSLCPPATSEIKQGDDWLASWIPKIQASQAYRDGGAILITWDEGESSTACLLANCPLGMLVLSPLAKGGGYSNTLAYDHSSTLKSVQEIFGVTPLLGAAAGAGVKDLADLFTAFP